MPARRDREAVAAVHGVADVLEVAADRAAGRFGLAFPGAADVDAGLGLDGQPMAELAQGVRGESGGEEHVRRVTRNWWARTAAHSITDAAVGSRACVRPDAAFGALGFVLGQAEAAFEVRS